MYHTQFLKETFSLATLPALVTSASSVEAVTSLVNSSPTYETTLSLIQEMMMMEMKIVAMKSQQLVVDLIFEDSYGI